MIVCILKGASVSLLLHTVTGWYWKRKKTVSQNMSVPVWGDNSSAPQALSQHPLVSKASAAVKNKLTK